MQFTHFGVLNTGQQSKSSLFVSITTNVVLGLICLIIGATGKKVFVDNRTKDVTYVAPLEKVPDPPKPKIVPPKLPPLPKVEAKLDPPKIKLPDVKLPDPPKPVEVPKPTPPTPVMKEAPPKQMIAVAAPKPVAVSLAQNASVPNHDLHPQAVALGSPTNPIHPTNAPATSAVNLGNRGLSGMPPGTGGGPPATAVSLGSGQPNGSLSGNGARSVQGVKLGGCVGCNGTGPGNATGTTVQQVQIAHATAPPPLATTAAVKAPASHSPVVLSKPTPVYTPEATAAHIEGTVTVKIHVSSTGAVSVLGVVAGLGHGLDQSAVHAAQGIRFKPATDATGNPVDWEGPVNIIFQIAS